MTDETTTESREPARARALFSTADIAAISSVAMPGLSETILAGFSPEQLEALSPSGVSGDCGKIPNRRETSRVGIW